MTGIDRNGDAVKMLDIKYSPLGELVQEMLAEPDVEMYHWHEDELIQRVCVICGKDLINQTGNNEGGLVERWICPLHGTRGLAR